jgi:hypothetical protein
MYKILCLLLVLGLAAAPGWALDPSGARVDSAAIRAAALDYGEGFYSGDASRMARAISEDMHKAYAMTLSENGRPILQYSTYSGLIELSRAKIGLLEPEKRKIVVTILDVKGDLASARLNSAMFNDYLQMVFAGGRWKIVNVLWTDGPDSKGRHPLAGFDPEKEKGPAAAAVRSFYDGILTGDGDAVEKAVHPELSVAGVVTLKQTGTSMISRSGAGLIIEIAREKKSVVPDGARNVDVAVLDVMDGMAFVRATTPKSTSYHQLQLMDGKWKIVNILNEAAASPAPDKK